MKAPEAVVKVAEKAAEIFGSQRWLLITTAGTAAFKILEDILGRKAPEDAPPEVKALYGIFGKGDELAFMRLLTEHLTKQQRDAVTGFLQWHFYENRRQSPLGGATVWWIGNAWRTFVTRLSTPGRKTSITETSTTKDKGKIVEDKKTVETFDPHGEEAIHFLKLIARTITTAADKETGYRKVLELFEAAGVPRMPRQETITWIEDNLLNFGQWFNFIKSVPVAINDWVDERYEQIQQREEARTGFFGGIVRGLRKLI